MTRGKRHKFLGLNLHITDDKKVEIDMKEQLMEAIEAFGEKIDGVVATPAQRHLFEVDENAEQLDEKKSDIFHSVTQKLLYITKRARPDLETLISFLTTRVSKSDVDDWKKLKRGLTFISNTIYDKRIIGAASLSDIYT